MMRTATISWCTSLWLLWVSSSSSSSSLAAAKKYSFEDLELCEFNTVELAQLGPKDELEPCIIFNVEPRGDLTGASNSNNTATIPLVQVTPSNCGNHRDGAPTAVKKMNLDNGGRGTAIGFQPDSFHVQWHLISVVAGNPATLSEDEYKERHTSILDSLLKTLDGHYIVGSCSFASEFEKQVALDNEAIVMAQVGPPGFYAPEVSNPYVFGFHINSDDYPLPNVQALAFMANSAKVQGGGPSSIPVRVVYRNKSEFFYSTCQSAIDKLTEEGFTDLKVILYDHAADNDDNGDINQYDVEFLQNLADEACPPDLENFHPALFVCTLDEQDILVQRWIENGCLPISLWVTASTWGWADENLHLVPYFQGGGQWHPTFSYSDAFFDSGMDLLRYNEEYFGYMGNYDQVVSYAIPVLYAQHMANYYRVVDTPDPLADFADPDQREILRRAMLVLNVETIFGPVSFNEVQRNVGRGAAGTQWLPINNDGSYANALVAPLLEAEAATFVPSLSSQPCDAGEFVDVLSWRTVQSLLSSACGACPVDTFTMAASHATECTPCPTGSTTDDMIGQDTCYIVEDNLLPKGIIAFGYTAVGITWCLSLGFVFWMIYHRQDPVVKVSQIEFLLVICFGAVVSSSTIVALSFQAGSDEDTTAASAGCTAAPFLYAIGWIMQYSSLSAKTLRLYSIMKVQSHVKRVTVTAKRMATVIVVALAIDLAILISWAVINPLVYERSEESTTVDNESGVVKITTVGRCVPENGTPSFWVFAGPLVAFHLCMVVGTNILLYNVREVADRYQEQKYVFLASMLMFEILIVGVPVLVAVNDNPTALYIVLVGIIALDDIGILCFIFCPKVMFQKKGIQEGIAFGESVIKESYKRASMRESFANSMANYSKREVSENEFSGSGESGSNQSKHFSINKDPFAARLNGKTWSAGDMDNRSALEESIIEETPEELKAFDSSDRSTSKESGGQQQRGSLRPLETDCDSRDLSSRTDESSPSTAPTAPLSSSKTEETNQGVSNAEDTRAKKPELEKELSDKETFGQHENYNRRDQIPGTIDEKVLQEHERMMEMSKKLMEDHERMMKATAMIMAQHESLKARMDMSGTIQNIAQSGDSKSDSDAAEQEV